MLAMDARRFLCAMQEATGGAVLVTERVWHETWERCVDACHKAARRTVLYSVCRGALSDGEAAERAVVAVAQANTVAMREWLEDERGRNDAAWQHAPSPHRSGELQLALLDSPCFTDNRNRHADAQMVAEALLAGAQVVASHNLNSIRHAVLNEWLDERRGRADWKLQDIRVPFILDPDAAARARFRDLGAGRRFGDMCLDWALSACVPNEPSSVSATRLEEIADRFTSNLATAGFAATAEAISGELAAMGARLLKERAVGMAESLAMRTRDAEDRRLMRQRVRLRESGYAERTGVVRPSSPS